MALNLSDRTERLVQEINIEANIIMEIESDAFPEVFGLVGVTRALRIGDFEFGDEYKIGGTVIDENSRDWISPQGTTTNITQKVDTDKPGGSSSVTTYTVNMVDKGGALTNMFSPGIRVPDVLGLEASVYWAAQGGAHPEDSVAVFRGVISRIEFGAGNVRVTIDSPQQLQRQDLLPKFTAKTTASITDSDTTIPLDTITGLVESQDSLTTYVRIEDEIIEVGGISGTDLTSCVRGSLGTTAVSHDIDQDAESFYRLTEDSPIDMALKLITSGVGEFGEGTVTRINLLEDLLFIQNSVFIRDNTFPDREGFVIGDTASITGASNAVNNITDREIIDIVIEENGTIIRFSGTDMVTEAGNFTIKFKSKYDTLNFGCEISPFHVDIERFEELKNLVGTQQPAFDIYIKDTISTARDFIDADILFPSGMFGVFRKGRISVGANLPPLSTQNTKTLSIDNVKDPEEIRINRTFKDKFYNSVAFKIEQNALDDRFLAAPVTLSNDSANRINVGTKLLQVEAKGVRDNPINRNKLQVQANRLLDRYQYGAETLTLKANFKTFTVEVGDSVVLNGSTLNLSDSSTGTRDYSSRVLECFSKSISLTTGNVELTLMDSIFQVDARYATVSPASFIGTGSTVNKLVLKRSFATLEGVPETRKWEDYVGQRIQVRSPDFTFQEIVTFVSIDGSDPNKINVIPDLSSAPLENYVIESPDYDDTDSRIDSFWKSQHAVPAKEIEIISGVSSTQFNVALGQEDNVLVGEKINVHSADYSDEIEVEVLGKTSNLITVEDLGFTPDSSYGAISIRFKPDDNGYVYRSF
jgi:hypothetical protein